MSQPTKKVIKQLTLVSLASSIALFSATGYGNEYLESAQQYLAAHDIKNAILQLKNAAQSTPKAAEPRLLLGKIYLQQGNYPEAVNQLSTARHLGADENTVAPLLGRAILAMGRNTDVIELVNEAAVTQPLSQANLLGIKALAQLNLGNKQDAITTLQLIPSGVKTQSVYALLAAARLSNTEQHNDSALDFVEQAIKLDPSNSDSWLLKGHLQIGLHQFDEAAQSYQKALNIAPFAVQYQLFIARALIYGKRTKEAEPYVDNILKIMPNMPLANDLKAIVLFSDQKYEAAKDYADRALNNGSHATASLLISAVSSYKLQLYEQANRRLKQVLPQLPENHYARRLYIATLMKLGYVDEAIQNMEKLNTQSKENSQFISQMSLSLSKLGREDEALSLAQKAYNSNKNQANELALGLVKLADKDESGLQELEAAVAEQPDKKKAAIGIAYYYLQLGKSAQAEKIADTWLAKNAKDVDALELKGRIYQANKQYAQAEDIFQHILTINSNHINAEIYMTQVLMAQGKMDQAYHHAYQAKILAPDNNQAAFELFLSALQLNQWSDVFNLLDKQIQQQPDDLILIQQKSQALMADKKIDEAISLLEQLPDSKKDTKIWILLSHFYYLNNQWQDAERACGNWLKSEPTDPNAYTLDIRIKEQTKHYAEGIKLADKALSIFKNDEQFTLLKAKLLIDANQSELAQNIINGLSDNIKDTPYALNLQKMIYASHKEFAKALTVQETIYKKVPGVQSASELAGLYEVTNQRDKAISFLNNVIKQYPKKAQPLELLLADIKSRNTTTEDSITLYKKILNRESKNIIVLNNLAALYMEKKQYSIACDYAQKAYNLAKDAPAIEDTQGYCLLQIGEIQKSLPILEKAYIATHKANAEIALHYAESLIKNHQTHQAKQIISAIKTDNKKLQRIQESLMELISHS